MSEKLDCSPSGIEATKKEITAVKKSLGVGGAGKGSAPRKVNLRQYQRNYDAIFRKKS